MIPTRTATMAIDAMIAECVHLAVMPTPIATPTNIGARKGDAREFPDRNAIKGKRVIDAPSMILGAFGEEAVALDTVGWAHAAGYLETYEVNSGWMGKVAWV